MKLLPSLSELFESDDFKTLLNSFEQLEQETDPIRREFALLKLAKQQRIPLSSYRRMFKSWMQRGGQS